MNKITMNQVAEKANVSAATVSRVINNNPGVSPKLKKRVEEAIEYYHFTPNSIARSLKTNKTKTIALIIVDTAFPFYATLSSHVEKALRNHGYMMLLALHQDEKELEIKCLETMLQMQVDAIIIATTNFNDEYINRIAEENTPVLLLERSSHQYDLPSIGSNKRLGFYQLIELLYQLNHRKFLFITGSIHISSNYARLLGIMDFIYEHNLPVDSVICEYLDFSFEHGYNSTKKILEMPEAERPTAIIAGNSEIAAGILSCLKDHNIKVPEEISVVSFGKAYMEKLLEKPITYLDDLKEELGEIAVDAILDILEGEKPKQLNIKINAPIINGLTTALAPKIPETSQNRRN